MVDFSVLERGLEITTTAIRSIARTEEAAT
jgi:hypothetical protein